MTMSCSVCNISFTKKANYDRHLTSQKHQKREMNSKAMFQCKNCYKYFSSKQGCYSHEKNCKISQCPKVIIKDNNDEKKEMQMQIHKQQQEIDNLKINLHFLLENGINNTTNNTNNTTNHIETQNVIVVNSFGSENTEYITDKIIKKLIDSPYISIPKLIEKIHFDPDHPENHNIKVTNKKLNYAEVVRDNKWVTTNKKKAIEDMIENGYNILGDKYTDNIDNIQDVKQERFESFQKKYNEEDKDLMKDLKEEVNVKLINGSKDVHNK